MRAAALISIAAWAFGCTTEFPSRGEAVADTGMNGADARVFSDGPPTALDALTPPDARATDDGTVPVPRPTDAVSTDGDPPADASGQDTDAEPPADAALPPKPDAAPCVPADETCNGLDDDCDGFIDSAATCGPFIAQQCRVWLAWADMDMGDVRPDWGRCPAEPEHVDAFHFDPIGCTSTYGDEQFHPVMLAGDVDASDSLGVAFTCDPAAGPASAWVQANCRVFFGQADNVSRDVLPDDASTWGSCPGANAGSDGVSQCIGSGGDGLFHAMRLTGDVNDDDRLAVAFLCVAPEAEGEAGRRRAEMLTAAVRVFFAYSADLIVADHVAYENWGECPGEDRDDVGNSRCASSMRDGRFHAFSMGTWIDPNLNGDDMLGVALISAGE